MSGLYLSSEETVEFLYKTLRDFCRTGNNGTLHAFETFRLNAFAVLKGLATVINSGIDLSIDRNKIVLGEYRRNGVADATPAWILYDEENEYIFAVFFTDPKTGHVSECTLINRKGNTFELSLGYSVVNDEASYVPTLTSK